jgi:septal ring factor EnvC (AmiA/AmiB activator)
MECKRTKEEQTERRMEQDPVKAAAARRSILFVARFCALSALCCVLGGLLFAVRCSAATPHEEYKKMQREINVHKRKLEEVKKRESSVLTDIENINKQLDTSESDLRRYKDNLANTEDHIAQVERDISINKGNIERHREWIKRKLRAIYEYGSNPELIMLFLGSDDSSQLMRNMKYLQYIAVYEHRLLDNFKGNLEGLTAKERHLILLRKELVKNKEKVREKEESLAETKKSRQMLLASVQREKSSRLRMLKEMEEASKKLLEIIRESERAAEKAETFPGKSFSSLKGRLPWPLDGKVALRYGSQRDPQFNTPIFRSGTFIESTTDYLAKAVHAGKVVFAEWFKGYGQLVIVNHGDGYHTLYGSLSEIFTKVGDIIKERQAVGRIGNSGIMNSPGLYFEVRYKGKPLDPLQWLRRK